MHVWDEFGRIRFEDVVPGLGQVSGIGMDRDDNPYVQAIGRRLVDGKPYFNDAACTLMKVSPKTKILTDSGRIPVPLPADQRPTRSPDIVQGPYDGRAWVENAAWSYGGVGNAPKWLDRAGGGCWCDPTQPALDYVARTFVPENDTYSIALLDSNGNLVLRIGRYGNVDDGQPLIAEGGAPQTHALGGDEVSLFLPRFLSADTDRRLFVYDRGNDRVVSVKLDYYATERVPLKDLADPN